MDDRNPPDESKKLQGQSLSRNQYFCKGIFGFKNLDLCESEIVTGSEECLVELV